MKYFFYLILTLSLLSACSKGHSGSSESETSNARAAEQMLAADDFDSTKTESAKPQEELPTRYTANSSTEAIELMNSLPEADLYRQGVLPRLSQECLDYAMRLINNAPDGFIIVDKESMQVAYYDRYGREKFRTGIACGRGYGTKHSKGDCRTPEGFFSVENIYDSTDWLYRDDNGKVSPIKGQFGPRFIRLSIPGTTQIGIHGTRAPGSIGCRASHGCIRVTNDRILELVKYAKPGMPVIVSPSRRDEKQNVTEGYHVPWVSVPGSPNRTPQKPDPSLLPKPSTPSVSRVDTLRSDTVKVATNPATPTIQAPTDTTTL